MRPRRCTIDEILLPIPTLVPIADDLLALEVEELGGVLLVHLNSYGTQSSGSGAVQYGKVSQYNFFNDLSNHPPYSNRQEEVRRALMEAWGWLVSEGFLVRDGDQPAAWFFLSRRAQRLKSRDDVSAYRKANLLPRGQLHPLIANRVYPGFLRGEYDTSVFQAFREVEIAVRSAGGFADEVVGIALMRDAFRPFNPDKVAGLPGPLTDAALPIAEQKGMADLFCGAIALYKNPQSHRNVPTDPVDAAEIIMFASHLLRIVDHLKPPT